MASHVRYAVRDTHYGASDARSVDTFPLSDQYCTNNDNENHFRGPATQCEEREGLNDCADTVKIDLVSARRAAYFRSGL